MSMTVPYLCIGTFMTQLLRFVDPTTNPRLRAKGYSDGHSERLIYRELINVYHMNETFLPESTLKTYASDVKSCKQSRPEFADFNNHDVRKDFEADIKRKNSISLKWMQDFGADYLSLHNDTLKERIVKIMLKMIAEDPYIEPGQKFYILGTGKAIPKSDFNSLNEVKIEALLLGVMHFIITKRYDQNESGAKTYAAMANDAYNDWLEKYDISHIEKIQLLGRSGISEKKDIPEEKTSVDTKENTECKESVGEETDSTTHDDDTYTDDTSTDDTTKSFTITPNVTQYIQRQVVDNSKTVINKAPIEHIENLFL